MQDSLNRSLKHTHAKAVPGLHAKPSRGKGKGKAGKKGKPKSRSKSIERKSKGAKGASRGRFQSREGKGKPSSKNVCYAFQKGTCTRGRSAGSLTRKNVGVLRLPNLALVAKA